jgi:dihydrofolate reductase
MTHIVYYVAASEDGFIAGPNGELDWLHAFESPDEDFGYGAFVEGIDALVMGRATFDVARSFPGPSPYGARPVWVMSRRGAAGALPATVRVTAETPCSLAALWQSIGLRRVWLVGGGEAATGFAAAGLIDEVLLATIPVVLGSGIALFAAGSDGLAAMQLVDGVALARGVVQRRYVRR